MATSLRLPEIGHWTGPWCLYCAFTLFCYFYTN